MQVSAKEYYVHLYPYEALVAWLTRHGHALERFEFALEGRSVGGDAIFRRYVVATTAADLRKQVGGFTGIAAFHIGGIYPERCNRRDAPTQRAFSIDIDLTDYEFLPLNDAAGNVSAELCDRAFPIAAFAIFVLSHLLTRAFGFREILACYSGRRGAHVHVTDSAALALSNEARCAVTAFMNGSRTEGGARASAATRGVAVMYGLIKPAMAAFTRTLVGEMDLFGNCDAILKFVARLELRHASLATLDEDAMGQDSGPEAWALIQSRVRAAGADWIMERLENAVLAYVWPRMDENVSKSINHLIKAPFCAHAKSKRIAVALNASHAAWNPASAPMLNAWNQTALDDAVSNFVTTPETSADIEALVAPPRPPPRKLTFKRKKSPLGANVA